MKKCFYRLQTKSREGDVFPPVCQSFCSQGKGGLPDRDPLDRDPRTETPWTDTPQTETHRQRHPTWTETPLWTKTPLTKSPLDRDPPWTETPCAVKSRQYASYWNAFLFNHATKRLAIVHTSHCALICKIKDVNRTLTPLSIQSSLVSFMLNEKRVSYIVKLQIAFLISAQVVLLRKVALMFVKYLGFSSIKGKSD